MLRPNTLPIPSLLFGLVVAWISAGAALARAQDAEAVTDESAKISGKTLLLLAPLKSSLGTKAQGRLLSSVDLHRFEILEVENPNPEAPELIEWCIERAKQMAIRREILDSSGSPLLTLALKKEACGQIYSWRIGVRDQCEATSEAGTDVGSIASSLASKSTGASGGKSYVKCQVFADVDVEHFRPADGEDAFRLMRDTSFGTGGHLAVSADGTSTVKLSGGFDPTKLLAQGLAAYVAGQNLWKAVLEKVDDFAIQGVVTANEAGTTFSCLGRDTVSLDQPFRIIQPGAEKMIGFVKARAVYDGCYDDGSAAGDPNLRPMEAENILGGSAIEPGMTLREMPSMGLAVGATAGSAPLLNEVAQPTFGVRAEYNLAQLTGISEFHAVIMARFALYTATVINPLVPFGTRLQLDLGVVKRWYFWGPIFIEGGGLLTGTGWISSGVDTLQTIGISGIGALGLQVSPRWTARVTGGLRLAGGLGANFGEIGPILSTDVLYTF